MGSCFSTTKPSDRNGNTPPVTVDRRRKQTPSTATSTIKDRDGSKCNQQRTQRGEIIPCGKRTDFGYDRDFDRRYTIGKLLGHGQFGYTYVAIDRASGERVAVKRIDKNKVFFLIGFCWFA